MKKETRTYGIIMKEFSDKYLPYRKRYYIVATAVAMPMTRQQPIWAYEKR